MKKSYKPSRNKTIIKRRNRWCPECDNMLEQHRNDLETDEELYYCEKCDEEFHVEGRSMTPFVENEDDYNPNEIDD